MKKALLSETATTLSTSSFPSLSLCPECLKFNQIWLHIWLLSIILLAGQAGTHSVWTYSNTKQFGNAFRCIEMDCGEYLPFQVCLDSFGWTPVWSTSANFFYTESKQLIHQQFLHIIFLSCVGRRNVTCENNSSAFLHFMCVGWTPQPVHSQKRWKRMWKNVIIAPPAGSSWWI